MLLFKHIKFLLASLLILVLFSCKEDAESAANYETSNLKIEELTDNVFVHTSYLFLPEYGKVGCNGMIYIHNNEALIFDTPTTDSVSIELINWIEKELECNVIGVLATHFHNDCLGGLKAFNDKGIKSYGNNLTIQLAETDSLEVPLLGFDNEFVIPIGDDYVNVTHFGEGHTKDNVVVYVATENVLFGGCLIKKIDASKGYLGDANVDEWSNTVTKIKAEYPNLKWVVPGHGKPGNTDLLDYTIKLFSIE